MCSSLLVCQLLYLFVCLCVCGQHYGKTRERIFMKFSGWVGHGTRNNLENLQSVTFSPLSTQFILMCFQENPCLLATLRENGSTDFHEIFSTGRQGTMWNIFEILQLRPWIQGRFYNFLDLCFLVMLWKDESTDFHEIFMKCQERSTK